MGARSAAGEQRPRLDPAVARTRLAVRRSLGDVAAGTTVWVACSGGPDSTALAAALALESRRARWHAGAVIVDHGWFERSALVAADVAERLRTLVAFQGLSMVEVVRVEPGGTGGREAAARAARYTALEAIAARDNAVVVLGHTRDDQAETVLLGLARGSGTRSIAGMRPVSGRYRRPFLDLPRGDTERACRALGLTVWSDPANEDEQFARVRVRRLLPLLEHELGGGVVAALARTARSAAEDTDALDALAGQLWREVRGGGLGTGPESADGSGSGRGSGLGDGGLSVNKVWVDLEKLAGASGAVRRRVLRLAALDAGCPGTDLSAVHIWALDDLVVGWHGQRGVDLPGHVFARRHAGRLTFERAPD